MQLKQLQLGEERQSFLQGEFTVDEMTTAMAMLNPLVDDHIS